MPDLSTFQTLPWHIAEQIAQYCNSRDQMRLHSTLPHIRIPSTWLKLYNVSSLWRVLASMQLFKYATLTLSTNGEGYVLENSWSVRGHEPEPIKRAFVKYVTIKFCGNLDEGCNISAWVFSYGWPRALVFPSVIQIYVDLTYMWHLIPKAQNTVYDERLFWITQLVQTSLPRLQRVTINESRSEESTQNDVLVFNKPEANNFLSSIFGKATSLKLKEYNLQLARYVSLWQKDTGLVRLECHFDRHVDILSSLFKASAKTLTFLKLVDSKLLNVKSLTSDRTGGHIVYPRLQRLEFYSDISYYGSKQSTDQSIAPFSALKYLRWNSLHTFKDDTLFRGNSDTLEFIDIGVDAELANILQKFRVFADGKYSQICHVSVRVIENIFTESLDSGSFIRLAIHLVSPMTISLSLSGFYFVGDSILLLSEIPYLENIHVLYMNKTSLNMSELLGLVKLFPNMVKLTCSPQLIESYPGGRAQRDYVASLYARYYPLNRRFRIWEVLIDYRMQLGLVAIMTLGLLALCPRFVSVDIPPEYRDEFVDHIDGLVDSRLYDNHRDRIQSLLRNIS